MMMNMRGWMGEKLGRRGGEMESITRFVWISLQIYLSLLHKALISDFWPLLALAQSHSDDKDDDDDKKGKHLQKIISLLSSLSACICVYLCVCV